MIIGLYISSTFSIRRRITFCLTECTCG